MRESKLAMANNMMELLSMLFTLLIPKAALNYYSHVPDIVLGFHFMPTPT